LCVPALFGGQPEEFRPQIGSEFNFHGVQPMTPQNSMSTQTVAR
jgi:hypothetical protein